MITDLCEIKESLCIFISISNIMNYSSLSLFLLPLSLPHKNLQRRCSVIASLFCGRSPNREMTELNSLDSLMKFFCCHRESSGNKRLRKKQRTGS